MKTKNTIQFKKKCKIGKYEYDPNALIGVGCYGKVYQGQRVADGFDVAIKVVDLNLHPDKEATKFVENELKIHQILKHDKVIDCLQIFKKNNIYYFITQYHPDGDLEKYLKNKGPLTEYEALSYFHQIVEGLVYLKQKKVIHRDLKPANIFMKQGDVVLADFGLSVICEREKFAEELRIGTPRYMAPETLKDGIYSHKCDVWSLGSLLIEMLVGQAPLARCDSFEEISQRVFGEMIPSTIHLSTDTRNMLGAIFEVCEKKRISIEELYSHTAFDPLIKKQFSSQTTGASYSEIRIEDLSFCYKNITQSLITSARSSLLPFETDSYTYNNNNNNNKFTIKSTSKLLKQFNQFLRNLDLQYPAKSSLEYIYQRWKDTGELGRVDYKFVMDKSRQVIDELQRKQDVNAQMEAINITYFRKILEESQQGVGM